MEIILVNGRGIALVDDADAERVNAHRWCLCEQTSKRNVVKRYARTKINGKTVFLHRFLHPEWAQVDHINGDGLDNQQANLREATCGQNGCNQGPRFGRKYKGVYSCRNGRYRAQITTDGTPYHLGTFDTDEEAARAYDVAAYEANPEHCRLNFLVAEALAA